MLLASFLRWELEEAIEAWICEAQRGLLQNWMMLDNILDVDCVAQRISLKHPKGAIVFWDFKAAFPSLSHECMFSVLQSIGLPTEHLHAVQALYADVQHVLVKNAELQHSRTQEHWFCKNRTPTAIARVC